ncbi:MAG: hypothetical protein GF313_05760 [Caldithrix sp.]|nr:hypothetical protein [Caldithrix sp.]
MHVSHFSFGRIVINGHSCEQDIIIDRNKISIRDKNPSRAFKSQYGHTPLSVNENIPWHCNRLIIGSGMYGKLPVLDEVFAKAKKQNVYIQVMPTPDAIKEINSVKTNFILHLTC